MKKRSYKKWPTFSPKNPCKILGNIRPIFAQNLIFNPLKSSIIDMPSYIYPNLNEREK